MQKNFETQKLFFETQATFSYEFRHAQLKRLELLLLTEKDKILKALYDDLKKPEMESLIGEWGFALEEVRLALKNLKKWMKPQKVPGTLASFPSKSRIYSEPLGVVLIMGPWNYPFQLVLAPLVGAIAAGNCVIIKPSEVAVNTANLIQALMSQYFEAQYISVVTGGIEETTEILKLPFDYIFFTGSTPVGKIVALAAAKNLTPVTLELGGKSPAVVCADADLKVTARRLVWGKFYNAGQTCVAPDYIYAHSSIVEPLKILLKKEIEDQFGKIPEVSQDLGRIINNKNFDRLKALIEPSKIYTGGKFNTSSRYIEPTLLHHVNWDDKVMQDEIFGPILPILTFQNFEEINKEIRKRSKPLAAYIFSKSRDMQTNFLKNISAGGVTINDVVVHLTNPNLPFGGVGGSGQGRYHGHFSFKTFSHEKSVLLRSFWFDIKARYAPYTKQKSEFLKRIIVGK